MRGVGSLVVLEGDPAPDSDPSLRPGVPSVQIDAFVRPGPPEAFDEDVVDAPALAIHRDPGCQPVSAGRSRRRR